MSPLRLTRGRGVSRCHGGSGPEQSGPGARHDAARPARLLELGEGQQVVHQQPQAHGERLGPRVGVTPAPVRGLPDVVGGLLVPEKSPLGGLHGVEVVQPVDRHVVLGDERRDLKVVPADDLVEVLHAREAVHLVLDSGGHERSEPPRHHLRPERRVYHIARLEVLLVLVRQYIVDLLEPLEGWVVGRRSQRVEVGDDVVALDQRVQQVDEVEQGLVQVDLFEAEPLADEDDDGPAEAVHAALVQAADAGHLGQVLGPGPAQQPLVPLLALDLADKLDVGGGALAQQALLVQVALHLAEGVLADVLRHGHRLALPRLHVHVPGAGARVHAAAATDAPVNFMSLAAPGPRRRAWRCR